MVTIAAIVLNGNPSPIEKYILESLRHFDEIITSNEPIVSSCSKLRNKLISSIKSDYFLFIDNDEIIHPEVYHHLLDIYTLYPDIAVAFPRVNLKQFNTYYVTRFPDYQARSGRKETHYYTKAVHETLVSDYFAFSNFPIIHYGNSLLDFNIERLKNTQLKWSRMGYSLYEELSCKIFDDLLNKLKSLPEADLNSLDPILKINIPLDLIKRIEADLNVK